MKQGDFTTLAENYKHRPAYSPVILEALTRMIGLAGQEDVHVAEVGAGTGKLTYMLAQMGLNVLAVEPNGAMREEGIKYTADFPNVTWSAGTGESTGLPNACADWVVMASSFHWTNPDLSLPEFFRILKTDGWFTAIWNPRNIEASPLLSDIEERIYQIAPHVSRVSSGAKRHTKNWEKELVATGHFQDVIFMETDHLEIMSKERYMGAWHSVNDLPAQAGEEKWREILAAIEAEIEGVSQIEAPYKNRAWTARKVK